MSTYGPRPGEFRICPRCSARQKGGYSRCQNCGSSLQGATVAERIYEPTHTARPLNRGLRVVLVLAVVGASIIGIVLRNTFSSAAFDQEAAAAAPETRLSARATAEPDASVYDRLAPVAEPAVPEGWYGLARSAPPPAPVATAPPPVDASATATLVEPGAHVVDPAAVGGMVGLAPQPGARIARRARAGAVLTNDDLAAMRSSDVPPPPPVEHR
jgi:hypothetical protein